MKDQVNLRKIPSVVNSERVGGMNRFTSAIIITITIILIMFTINGPHGWLQLQKIKGEIKHLQSKNLSLQSDILKLSSYNYSLLNSEYLLEKNAREDMGLSKPGEIVYIFPQTPGEEKSRQGVTKIEPK